MKMLSKIEYVYDKGKVLLGAKVFSFNGEDIQSREFYVGESYSVNELCSNIELVKRIGIKNLELLKGRADAVNASGIIYFPQAKRYDFLEASDIVLPYEENTPVVETLETIIAPYRENTISRDELMNFVSDKYHDIDPDDSRSELCDLPLFRHKQKVSTR